MLGGEATAEDQRTTDSGHAPHALYQTWRIHKPSIKDANMISLSR